MFYQESFLAAEQNLGLGYVANQVVVSISDPENKYSTAEDLNICKFVFQIQRRSLTGFLMRLRSLIFNLKKLA